MKDKPACQLQSHDRSVVTPYHCAHWKLAVGAVVMALLASGSLRAAEPETGSDKVAAVAMPAPEMTRGQRIQWWRDARFGMFIHWGLYAIPGGVWKDKVHPTGYSEWIMFDEKIPANEYAQLAAKFNPVKFDAKAWTAIAGKAGMKYMVLTTKHHDGFSMFKSGLTRYNVADATPFKRDVTRELADACRDSGMRFGCYYSIDRDWYRAQGPGNHYKQSNVWDYPDSTPADFDRYLATFAKPQVMELLTNYRPDLLWFDEIDMKSEAQVEDLYQSIRKLRPEVVINSRIQGCRFPSKIPPPHCDYISTGDNEIADKNLGFEWENPGSMNTSYGYNQNDHNWVSAKEVVSRLVDIVSKGGNYLLNVGPTPDGLIPQPCIDTLLEVGTWMDTNGEAIYGTSPWRVFHEGPPKGADATAGGGAPVDVRFTAKGDAVYAICMAWPDQPVVVRALGRQALPDKTITAVKMLGSKDEVHWRQTDAGLTLTVPAARPCNHAYVYRIDLTGTSAVADAADGRTTVPLAGTWQMAEGTLEDVPKSFDHQAPVPGLADMAVPAFEGVGTKDADPRRAAFWYRRAFTIDGPVPAVARLKVHKARYGTRVYLNGASVGEHVGCFTPGYFDLAGKLIGGGQANELVIRVGAAHTALGDDVPWGHDFEKLRYIPGIYDNVELVLSGTPDIDNVQVVPDVADGRVRVVARVGNRGAEGREGLLRCTVREAKTGKTAGTADSGKMAWKAGEQQSVEVVVPLESCRLWTPEDPFLYEVEVSVVARPVVTDTQKTRFGMRSFAFDPQTKRPMLNGKPYYLRGTNICIDRFFEDPLRGDKPWREDWVRSLIRAFRGMHWNSARYCIGFPPELWYRIADEEGLLVQDEFPVWGETGSLDNLTKQFGEWMEERWNHPSVVIWDAQNETPKQDITGKALAAVRHLDLSNRPWDNGWGEGQAPTDVYEIHPYRHIDKNFRMADLAGMAPRPDNSGKFPGNPLANVGDRPIIVNEYGWLWINRDGTPCTLPVEYKSYQYLLPPNPSAEQYREAYARTIAAKTEFWRAGRQLAGVMHFCGLGYSRPGGQTSDSLSDVEHPTFERHFARYVKDAFAPVGVMLDFWAADCAPGMALKLPVVVVNDLATDWHGPVTLRLSNDGKVLAEMTQDGKVAAYGREVLAFELKVPEVAGKCQFIAELRGADGMPVRSLRDVSVR